MGIVEDDGSRIQAERNERTTIKYEGYTDDTREEKGWVDERVDDAAWKSHKHAFYSFFNLSHANVCTAHD